MRTSAFCAHVRALSAPKCIGMLFFVITYIVLGVLVQLETKDYDKIMHAYILRTPVRTLCAPVRLSVYECGCLLLLTLFSGVLLHLKRKK